MKRAFSGIYLLSLLVFLLSACKKEKKDTIPPTIDVILPASGAAYDMFDTIVISGNLKDETGVQRLEITLRDQNGDLAQPGVILNVSGTDYPLNALIELYEYRMPTGNYTLEFSLSDGNNVTIKSVPIYITESPFLKKGYYFVARNATEHFYYRTDTNYTQSNVIHHTGSFEGAAITNYYQQLYTASGIGQNFRTYNMHTNIVKWTLSNAVTGANTTCCISDGKNVYLGKNDGNVYKYNSDGAIIRSYLTSEVNYFVKYIYYCDAYLVVCLQDMSSTNVKKTLVFDSSTGIVRKVIQNTDIRAACLKSAYEIYLFSNNPSGHAVIEILTLPGGSIQQRFDFGAYEAYGACMVDNNTLLLSTSEGKIWQYQNSTTNVIPVLNTVQAKQMKYSGRARELYVASDRNFYVYGVAPFLLTPKSNTVRNDTIADFQVIFNK
ncbi:MAG: hypothetical protein K0S33_2957 [Bacteroidetes bacterium]|jgi:hypothetical protein|nr:hypothetical protein [Bacteroidota bacterium]